MTRLLRNISIHAAMVAVLVCFVAFIAAVASFPIETLPLVVVFPLKKLIDVLPWALIASQLAANYLAGVQVKK